MRKQTTKADDAGQHQKFMEAAAAVGCSNSVSVFDEALLRIIQISREPRHQFRATGDIGIPAQDRVE
jgi:hypothetical protein